MRQFRQFLKRMIHKPRLRWLKDLLGPYFLSGFPHNQWLRVVMNRETEELVNSLRPDQLRVLEVSGNIWDRPGLFKEYRSVHYPEYDLCEQVLEESFDLIIAEQVFEHLMWPYRAGKNVRSMLRSGGSFLITTPFLIRIHAHPDDYSRWTEAGMRYFLAECGFPLEHIQTGSWGNRSCAITNLGNKWQIYQRWRHSLKNEPDCPCVVWALARK